MKNKITVAIGACSIYGIYIFLGLCFCENFSEYAIIGSFIYFGILILNFYFIHWKDSFIADFIIEKKLNFLFIVLAIIYLVILLVSFFSSDGLDKIMLGTIWISVINVCVSNYLYLR